MPRLIFTQPEFRQKFLELCDGAFSLGRSGRNQIIIEDASVSKEHADLLVHGNEIIVRERGSQNGTFVGGARIKAQSGVKHGEKIRFGRVELLLELGSPVFQETTAITAMADLARMCEESTATSRMPTQFPVRFVPEGLVAQGTSTIAPPEAESDLPALPAQTQSLPGSNSSGSSPSGP